MFHTYSLKFISFKQRPIDRCGPRGPKQQRPRGSQRYCDLDAAPLQMKLALYDRLKMDIRW